MAANTTPQAIAIDFDHDLCIKGATCGIGIGNGVGHGARLAVAVDINWLANGGQIGRENNGVNPRTGDVEKDAVQPWRARRATAHSDIGVGCGNGIAQRTNRCIPRGVGGRIDDDAHEDRMRRRSHKQPGTQQGRDKRCSAQ